MRSDLLDIVWGIFDEDGDGQLTKSEFMDVRVWLASKMDLLCAGLFTLSLGARGPGVAWGEQEKSRQFFKLHLIMAEECWFLIREVHMFSRGVFGSESVGSTGHITRQITKRLQRSETGTAEPTSKKIHFTLWRCAQQHVQWHRARIQFGKKQHSTSCAPPFSEATRGYWPFRDNIREPTF
jgi:hypothetical protein